MVIKFCLKNKTIAYFSFMFSDDFFLLSDHNRMHAADVLHGVYYLTSQPIPGFTQIPSDATDSPLHKYAGKNLF